MKSTRRENNGCGTLTGHQSLAKLLMSVVSKTVFNTTHKSRPSHSSPVSLKLNLTIYDIFESRTTREYPPSIPPHRDMTERPGIRDTVARQDNSQISNQNCLLTRTQDLRSATRELLSHCLPSLGYPIRVTSRARVAKASPTETKRARRNIQNLTQGQNEPRLPLLV